MFSCMRYIDLHVHSRSSDGSDTPAALAALAAESGLAAVALTDHDTVGGVPEFLEAAPGVSAARSDRRSRDFDRLQQP